MAADFRHWDTRFQLALLLFFAHNIKATETLVKDFTHHVVLDHEGTYSLWWLPEEEHITFKVEVETTGWLGLGFSLNGRMKGSDMVMVWMKGDGRIHLDDRHSTGHRIPKIDQSQDYHLIEGQQNDTHLSAVFRRKWDTCDPYDMVLGDDTVKVIWGYHPNKRPSSPMRMHRHKRKGVRSLHLKEDGVTGLSKFDSDRADFKKWDITAKNVQLPNDDHTHYYCQIFKAPPTDGVKHHMVGFEPLIQEGHEPYVHHMVLYECHVDDQAQSSEWFERHVDSQGHACYSPNMPQEWSFCLATNAWAWAVGSSGERLPDHVGMPLGEAHGGATYFMLETHYDNPGIDPDLVDKSGLRIYYTDKLRQHDTGMVLVGTEVNFLHMVPPLQDSFQTVGRCTSQCTSQGFHSGEEEEGGVHILSGVLHSHLASRKMRLRHLRDGSELPTILEDNNYDFNFQSSRKPKGGKEVEVLPGDELLLECDYQTSDRRKPTFGGLSTREEMCLGFVLYYPRRKLADCRSLPAPDSTLAALGIESFHGTAFPKLMTFLRGIGRTDVDGQKALAELLTSLTAETNLLSTPVSAVKSVKMTIEQLPLSEEDLLKKPFYTVEEEPSVPSAEGILGSLPEQGSNYRNLLLDMLLNVRIKLPSKLNNLTLGQHLTTGMDWENNAVAKTFQERLYFGKHSSLCLAHGRKSITPYEELPFPQIKEDLKKSNYINKCGNHSVSSPWSQTSESLKTRQLKANQLLNSGFNLTASISIQYMAVFMFIMCHWNVVTLRVSFFDSAR